MKKLLFLFVSLVAMACTMTTMVACAEEEDLGVLVSVESGIGMYENKVSQETHDKALASKKRMDARLEKMFGKGFNIKCKVHEVPDDEAFIPYNKIISSDKEIQKEIDYLRRLTTIDGEQAVYNVVFHYTAGEHEFTPFAINI